MKDYLYLGLIANTHGIKGEIKIISNFERKDLAFKVNSTIYIGKYLEKKKIKSYRHHQNFEMITLDGIDNINDVLKYKGLNVYVKREDLNLKDNEYIIEELIGMKIRCDNKDYGIVKNIFDNNGAVILEIDYQKHYYIPKQERYIKNVNLKSNIIEVCDVEDLIL